MRISQPRAPIADEKGRSAFHTAMTALIRRRGDDYDIVVLGAKAE